MQITKKEIIQKLYDIADANNLKLGREVQKVVRSETIPLDIIKLINKYDKNFLQIYDTYNTIYSSRNKNPLYRNLRNSHLDISETAIAMSSLVTKILISCSKIAYFRSSAILKPKSEFCCSKILCSKKSGI